MFENCNQLIMKVTRGCNLRCDYCYVHNKDDYGHEVVDFNTFKTIVKRIITDKLKDKKFIDTKAFNIVFHGGEPLFIGYDKLTKMVKYADYQFKKNNIPHSFGLQTNLTLMNEKFLKLFKEYNFSIGISYDGVGKANTKRTSTFKTKAFKDKFDLIKKNDLTLGILMVATKTNLKFINKSANFLSKNYDCNGLKVNYVEDVSENNSKNEITGTEFFENVLKQYILKYIKSDKKTEANTLQHIKKFIYNRLADIDFVENGNCYIKFCGGGIRIIEIEPNGKVFFCGRYSEEYDDAYLMHINDKDLLSLKQIQKHLNFQLEKHKAIKNAHCDVCNADYLCDHGCMAFHYSKYKKFGIRTELVCDAYQKLDLFMYENEIQIFEEFIKRQYLENIKRNIDNKNQLTFGASFGQFLGLKKSKSFSYLKENGLSVNMDLNNMIITLSEDYINKKIKRS